MKTPKDKAIELYIKYNEIIPIESSISDTVNECALFAVEEMIKDYNSIHSGRAQTSKLTRSKIAYWNEVKDELLKL